MANNIFEALLLEKINIFKTLFTDVSNSIFYDESGKLIHPGEYGMYKETACKEFLKFVIPNRLDISQGFLINSHNEHSHQCDIVIYDSKVTPIIESGERQRFFPVETVVAVGEVKSTLTKTQFTEAINKLSKVKHMREKINNPTIIKRDHWGKYDPINYPYDQIFTFLVCNKLDFNIGNIASDINSIYQDSIPYRYRHNLILSIEDGLLLYYDNNKKNMMYPEWNSIKLKNRFVKIHENPYTHFKIFASYLFLGTTSGTILYPEITDYFGSIQGSVNQDES